MAVFEKLHKVQTATRSLAVNAEGQTGAARYGYVSGSKLLGVIRPLMDNLGLILTQEVIGITNQPITYCTRSGEKTEMFTTIHVRFTWIDSEDGSTIVNDFFANGMNAWDKGLGSALTYAERYYLMKTFHIATDEDDVDNLVKAEAVNEPTPVQQRRKAASREASAPAYKPMEESQYWKVIECYTLGIPTKSGDDYRSAWIKSTNAGAAEVQKFDNDVQNFIAARNQ